MRRIKDEGCKDDICVNDLEAPAFSKLPELLELKNKLKAAARVGTVAGGTDADAAANAVVFMSGSGSTIVQVGSDEIPAFVAEDEGLFRARTRLITRQKGEWYKPSAFLERA